MSGWRTLVQAMGCCVAVAAIGCDGGNYATVSGIVSHNGSPVDGAKVEFHGMTEHEGGARDIFATHTDSSGKYLIAAGVKNEPGIPPGMYKVVISKFEGKSALTRPEEGMDAGQLDAQMSDGGAGAAPASAVKNHLPNAYASPDTTKLSATVESGKNENVNFDLQ